MLRTCLLALAFALMSTVLAQPPKKEVPTVRVIRVEVLAAEPADGDQPAQRGSVGVNFRIAAPGRELVGLNRISNLKAFTDDKGTDLGNADLLDNVYTETNKDHSSMRLQLYTQVAPDPKAREFQFKADLKVMVGVGVETNSEMVAFTPGSETVVGPVKVTIGGARNAPAFTLSYVRQKVKDVEFEDGNGNALKAILTSGSGRRNPQNPNEVDWRQDYRLDRAAPAKLTVRVRSYKSIETINVPVDIKFGLGLE